MRVTNPDGSSQNFGYDAVGNMTSAADELGRTTRYTYDVLDNVVKVDAPSAGSGAAPVSTYARYNALGEATDLLDALGRTTHLVRDNHGWVTEVHLPEVVGQAESVVKYKYDLDGRQKKVTDPLGHVTDYDYDWAARLERVVRRVGPGEDVSVEYAYDVPNRSVTQTDAEGHNTKTFSDSRGRLTETQNPNGDSVHYGYQGGLLYTIGDADDNITTYHYDPLGRLFSDANDLGDSRYYKYDLAGNLVEQTDRNGRVTRYEYDDMDRVIHEKWMNGEVVVQSIDYAWDAAGQLLSAADPLTSQSFKYDGQGRTEQTQQTSANGNLAPNPAQTADYYLNGLRQSLAFSGPTSFSTSSNTAALNFTNNYKYDAQDRLTGVTRHIKGVRTLLFWSWACYAASMPRSPRADEAGGLYHALNRGNSRAKVFHKDADFEAFERILGEGLERYAVNLFAFQLMPNHWHLVLRPNRAGEMSRFLRWITATHTMRYHAHYHTTGQGHVYQGRFKSFPIQDDGHFLTVCRYVERNAVRAKLVERAEDWRWGSLWRWLQASEPAPRLLSPWPIARSAQWVERVNRPLADSELAALRRSAQRGAPWGGPAWAESVAQRLGLESTLRPRGRPRIRPEEPSSDESKPKKES